MRRTTRKGLINLTLFSLSLFLVVYFNTRQSPPKTFDWTTIRYKTPSHKLPESRGSCPGLRDTSKPALVVSRMTADEDEWLESLKRKYHVCVYTVDTPVDTSSDSLQIPANRGHEAMAYLTFLIDNYEDFSKEGAVFVHGQRKAWHNDSPKYDNAELLAALNISAALEPWGYHNLRCDWSAGMCPPTKAALPQGSLETYTRSVMEPWNVRVVSDAALPKTLAILFGEDASDIELDAPLSENDYEAVQSGGRHVLPGRSDPIRAQCCAQFVVSRDRVWQHTKAEYVALRQWLLDSSREAALTTTGSGRLGTLKKNLRTSVSDDRVAGRILSYIWHILFLGPIASDRGHVDLARLNGLACPRADECYCRLYGRCNLKGCLDPGHCRGQYKLPPGYRLPADDRDELR